MVLAVYDRDWFAPVVLAAKNPVAQTIVDFLLGNTLFLKVFNDLVAGLGAWHIVIIARVNHTAFFVGASIIWSFVLDYSHNW